VIARVARTDRAAILFLPKIRRSWLNPLMIALSFTGSGFIWFPGAAVMIAAYAKGVNLIPRHELFLACMTGSLFSLIAGQIMKRIVRRARPHREIGGHRVIGMVHNDYSMPSTHTSTSMAVFTGCLLHGHPWAAFLGPWALAVMFSRYYLGVHFPTDLLAGAVLGAGFAVVDWQPLLRALFM